MQPFDSLCSRLNAPRAEDCLVEQVMDYSSVGPQGDNAIWDFSNVRMRGKDYKVSFDSVKHESADFISMEHQTKYYYKMSNDSLFLCGYENPTTSVSFSCPELLLNFPMTYGQSISSSYEGKGKYCNKVDMKVYGLSRSRIDGRGILVLPTGDTLRHVLRLHRTKRFFHDFFSQKDSVIRSYDSIKTHYEDIMRARLSTDSLILYEDVYQWYAPGYRYPVYESILARDGKTNQESPSYAIAFFYPPSAHMYLTDDQANRLLIREKATGKTRSLYGAEQNELLDFGKNIQLLRNGNKLSLSYFLNGNHAVSFGIYDIKGYVYQYNERTYAQAGIYHEDMNIAELKPGIYIVKITLDGYDNILKFIKD
uniref:T9SS type A sorting domain-containing protein n=1 Tax=Prevotella sp. GTC17253 TaxID=3236793 RepID=A0AB33IVX0_9BACT